MPTDPRAGFFLVPAAIEDDEDFQGLNAEQRGIWFSIMARCYRNYRPWTHRGVSMPAYSMITTYPALQAIVGIGNQGAKRLRTTVRRLADHGWIEVTSRANRFTTIRLVKSERWQSFETYRGQTKGTPWADGGQTIGSEGADDRQSVGIGTTPTPTPVPTPSQETTTEGELFADPNRATTAERQLADRHRNLHLKHTAGIGIKTDAAWRRKRDVWALEYMRLRGELDQAAIERAQDNAYADTHAWKDGTCGWQEALGRATNPAATLVKNIQRFAGAKEKPYSAGPGYCPHLTPED